MRLLKPAFLRNCRTPLFLKMAQEEEVRQGEQAAELAERDRASAELRARMEADAGALRRAQKAVEAERAQHKARPLTCIWMCIFGGQPTPTQLPSGLRRICHLCSNP